MLSTAGQIAFAIGAVIFTAVLWVAIFGNKENQ